MTKAAIVVLAGTEQKSDLGRVVNALETVREFDQEGDDVELVFDGAGTQWIAELEEEDHDYHSLYESVSEHASVCDYCAQAYGATDAVEESDDAEITDEFDGHPSVRSFVEDGYEVITY